MNKLKRRVQQKLGITELTLQVARQRETIEHLTSVLGEETVVGVDVHLKSPSLIIVFTRAAGGQIRLFEANIKSLRDVKEFADYIAYRYGVPKHEIWSDSPYGDSPFGPRRRY
jgi:hypothetical protein